MSDPKIQRSLDQIAEADRLSDISLLPSHREDAIDMPIEALPYYSESLRQVAGNEQAKLNIVGSRLARYMLIAIAPLLLLVTMRFTLMQASFLLQEISAIVQGEVR